VGKSVTVRYLTPHNKWSIHSEYQDNLFMLSLSRGGPDDLDEPQDADKIGVADNDWIEATTATASSWPAPSCRTGCPRARSTCTTPRTAPIDVPLTETTGSAAASTTR
jgi:nitrate reductase alpha subunit